MSSEIPPGKAAGALPRKTKFGSLAGVPIFRDRIDVIPIRDWPDWYDNNGVKHLVNDINDQDGVGSCASEACCKCIELIRELSGMSWVHLSPWSLYRLVNGGSDAGSTLDDNVRVSMQTGVLTMATYPRSMGWRTEPPAGWQGEAKQYRTIEWFDIGSKEEFGTALIKRFPVFYGRAGHAITAVQLTSSGVIYANSWDESWGDDGFGFDRWSDIEPSIRQYGCFALRSVVRPSTEGDLP